MSVHRQLRADLSYRSRFTPEQPTSKRLFIFNISYVILAYPSIPYISANPSPENIAIDPEWQRHQSDPTQ